MRHLINHLKNIIMVFILLMIMLAFANTSLFAQNPMMRYPDIHDNTVVFVTGSDIWKSTIDGGVATRLTFNDGQENFPKISPAGKLIAFTGEYDGNADVYVMNIDGGDIKRITFHPGFDEVIGWNKTKNKIMFTSGRNSTSRYTKLFLISPDGNGLEETILYDVARASYSPDGSMLAYNKDAQDNATWKRYKGGRAQEIYVYDFNTNQEVNITNYDGSDRLPMWVGDKIYFASDRDRVLNIWAYDTNTKWIDQITKHSEYDVQHPSAGNGNRIVYELGGDIWILDLNTKESKKIPIQVLADMEETRPYLKDISSEIQDIEISPSGKRGLIVARGEVFTVPQSDGPTRNISNNCGARDKDAVWSPDGKWIAYFSDKSGEYEIYVVNANGKEDAIKLTTHKDGYRHTLKWSPDSRNLSYTDQTLTLYYIDVATKAITKIDKEEYENVDVSQDVKSIYDYSWSPDSKYIVYSKMNNNFMYQLFVYSLETKAINCISNGLFHDFSPVFSKDGEFILFISDRIFEPTYCDIEWEMVYQKVAGIYAINLKKDGKSILPYKSDEEISSDNNSETKSATTSSIHIDFDGITDRIESLPLKKGNYRNLQINDTTLFYLNYNQGNFNRFEVNPQNKMSLYSYSFSNRKERTLVEDINSYKLSFNGENIIYLKDNNVTIIPSSGEEEDQLKLSDLKIWYEPIKEWKQIFNEAWRMERDYYYEPNMHGQDWNFLKQKYGQLVDKASCRQDLTFIIGELIGELNTSHTYVYGGDYKRNTSRVNIGMLGADYKIDTQNNLYQFKKIFRERDWSREIWPPLAKPGINVIEGDYLLKVNGVDVKADKEIYGYFVGLCDKQVTLTVNSKPTLTGAREVVVEPSHNENSIRHMDWLESNRLAVDKASNGKIGYIYMPDTWNGSAIDFPKYFYSQTKKEGIILDGRFNGGGLDPEIFLERLLKKPHGFWTRRNSVDQTIPATAVQANMALLTNRYAGSGGDELPYEFQLNKMGPVIGTRTWGGLVGVSMFIQLIDGGGLTAPDYRIYNEKGEWVVENKGVTPDIIIDIDSKKMSEGYDTQLMKAVDELMKKINENPRKWPIHQAFPMDK
ncbi:MAG: peptidase S41 [Bacteroidales bacterium]|nr:peptidase S41 [Bacteroidales bacterium]